MEVPKPVAIAIIAVIAVLAIGVGLFSTGVIGGGSVPETEQLKADEAVQRYQQYGGGTNAEFEARQRPPADN